MPLNQQAVDLGVLLDGLATGFRDQWEGQRELALERGVQALVVTGDPDRLEQVFANLVDNAAKYSAPGSPVHLAIGSDGDW
jgi:signal transduction histidine kinase